MTRHPGRQHAIVLLQSSAIGFFAAVALTAQADEGHHHAAPAHPASRTIVVRMTDTMRFEPAVATFERAETLEMACLEPGHYEAGMRGRVDVTPHAAHGGKP